MQQYTVPQFIDAEDKIVGPVSVRQFVIMLVAGGMIFLAYQITDFSLFILSAIIIGGIAAVLAFYKVNGQPFHMFLLHVTQTVKDPSLRVWRKEVTKSDISLAHEQAEANAIVPAAAAAPRVPIGGTKLAELSLVVDTGGAFQGGSEQGGELFE